MKDNKGFTLAELLIAMVLSGIVLTGVYAIFNSIVVARDVSQKAGEAVKVNSRLTALIASDFRQAISGTIESQSILDGIGLRLITHNSLFFQGTLPVEVLYYVDEGYLYREEKLPLMDFEQKTAILPDADNFTVLFYSGGEYHERTIPDAKLIKVRLNSGGIPIEALAGNYHENKYINKNGIGE
jgi:prepilin-type N-terminal cleavage/methylation domain-containing protein